MHRNGALMVFLFLVRLEINYMSDILSPVRVRFAPSPTGFLHVGGLRTALYNWFLARRTNGTFILRIEDTDRSRFVEGAIEGLVRSLARCGLAADEGVMLAADGSIGERGSRGPYIQSKRREKHLAYAYELIEKGAAYYCFCTEEDLKKMSEEQVATKRPQMYDRRCRAISKEVAENRAAVGDANVIRLKVPTEGVCRMHDLIRGDFEIPWAQVDDQVLIKSDGYPTYHLAATCDDHDMEITHVVRGDEWLSSLPKHLYLAEIMGWKAPQYAHLPLLLNPDRSKLSKRQGDVAVEDYLEKGYLPEALVNFVALLGWNPTSDREIFAKEELASLFDVTKVNKAGAVFNVEKLDWLNGQYLHQLPQDQYLALALPALAEVIPHDEALRVRAAKLFHDRALRVQELPALVLPWLTDPTPDPSILVWKTLTNEEMKERLARVRTEIASCSEEELFDSAAIETRLKAWIIAQGWGNGEVLWPLRVSLSGAKQSPSPFELLFLLGKDASLRRIDAAVASLA